MTTRTTLTKRWTRKTTTMTTARAPMVGHEVLSKREVGGGEGLGGGRHRLQSGRAAGSFGEAFQAWEPVFAVVQIGSHQFKLILNKVLMLGSRTQTVIGRPILPDSAVHAVIEEHALDAKVIIFKKKRRKNYRRTKGHRQELTKLRITDIQGIEKSEGVAVAA